MEGAGEVWEAVAPGCLLLNAEERGGLVATEKQAHLSDITVSTDTWSTSRQDKIYGRPSGCRNQMCSVGTPCMRISTPVHGNFNAYCTNRERWQVYSTACYLKQQ